MEGWRAGGREGARLHVDVVGQQQKPGPFVSGAPAAKIADSESYNIILYYIILYYIILYSCTTTSATCCCCICRGEALPASFIVQ